MKMFVNLQDVILRPPELVYESIINPEILSSYFTSKASGIPESGETLIWYFEDVRVRLAVKIISMEQPKHLCFEWSPGENTRQVNIYLEALASGNTKIRIVEKEWNIDEPGARAAMSQTEGWTDFISCLKAYLYTGVRLR